MWPLLSQQSLQGLPASWVSAHHLSGLNNLSKQLRLAAHSSDSAALSLAASVLPELYKDLCLCLRNHQPGFPFIYLEMLMTQITHGYLLVVKCLNLNIKIKLKSALAICSGSLPIHCIPLPRGNCYYLFLGIEAHINNMGGGGRSSFMS